MQRILIGVTQLAPGTGSSRWRRRASSGNYRMSWACIPIVIAGSTLAVRSIDPGPPGVRLPCPSPCWQAEAAKAQTLTPISDLWQRLPPGTVRPSSDGIVV